MKTIAKLAALVAATAVSVTPIAAQAQYGQNDGQNVCLKTYFIDSTHVVDAKTILFRMKDGTVYRNDLAHACTGLKWDGFVYVLHYDELCSSDHQSICILRSHEVCQLGGFTKVAPTTHA